SINVQVTTEKAAILDVEKESVVGYLSKGFTFNTDEQCKEWCYFTLDDRKMKLAEADVSQTKTKKRFEDTIKKVEATEFVQIVRETTIVTEQKDDAQIIAYIAANQSVPIISTQDEWAKIEVLNQIAYMKRTNVLEEQSVNVHNVFVVDTASSIYSSKQLEKEGEIAILQPNVPIEYIAETNDYFAIELGQSVGYVEKSRGTKTNGAVLTKLKTEPNASGGISTTNAQVPVYTEMSVDSQKQMVLLQGLRYPIEGQWEDWYILRIGGQVGYVAKQEATLDKGIPVLMYHHVLPESELATYKGVSTTITAEAFEEQMTYLVKEQFKVLTKQELLAYLQGELILPLNAVMITFDDGLLSSKEYAYPILKQHGLQALQHIISARKDREDGFQEFDANAKLQFVTDEEMEEMKDVFSYEAHTFNLHILDPDTQTSRLVKASAGELRDDLLQNLEDLPNATAFAYPFGQYTEETIEVLRELDFKLAFTTQEGYTIIGENEFLLKRFGPTQDTTLEQFVQYVNRGIQY
ncbi:MAG: polysaccharide deacetylase family protein, partial [Lysinibacillus sp.]